MRGGRAVAIGAIGESPDRKSSIDISIIGISGILRTKCLGISTFRCSKPRQETRLRSCEIVVTWAKGLARRANGSWSVSGF
jgi:hypothetical protein